MTNYDKTFILGSGQGSSQKASNEYIIIHDTANDDNQGDNSAYNEASYMHNNWQNAYTHAIAGWDRVYLVKEAGYVAYGAGKVANSRAPFQIELAHYSDHTKQMQSYINYINAVREYANKFGIPLTLDGDGKGIKSHKWVSDNIWGDHQDPYAYLERIGISKQQLAHDLANGVDGTAPTPKPASKPAPQSQPKQKISVDGYWGLGTWHAMQDFVKQPHDDVISGQSSNNKFRLSGITMPIDWSGNGSQTIAKWQKWLGIYSDGVMGKDFIGTLQTKLRSLGYYHGLIDQKLDHPSSTIKALQQMLNER